MYVVLVVIKVTSVVTRNTNPSFAVEFIYNKCACSQLVYRNRPRRALALSGFDGKYFKSLGYGCLRDNSASQNKIT